MDPDSLNPDTDPDPAFQVDPDTDPDPIWIQGFDDQKIEDPGRSGSGLRIRIRIQGHP